MQVHKVEGERGGREGGREGAGGIVRRDAIASHLRAGETAPTPPHTEQPHLHLKTPSHTSRTAPTVSYLLPSSLAALHAARAPVPACLFVDVHCVLPCVSDGVGVGI